MTDGSPIDAYLATLPAFHAAHPDELKGEEMVRARLADLEAERPHGDRGT